MTPKFIKLENGSLINVERIDRIYHNMEPSFESPRRVRSTTHPWRITQSCDAYADLDEGSSTGRADYVCVTQADYERICEAVGLA